MKIFSFVILFILFVSQVWGQDTDCSGAEEASSQMSIAGDAGLMINCQLNPGQTQFPVVFQITNEGSPLNQKVSFTPELSGTNGFEILSPQGKGCSDDFGIAVVQVKVDCSSAVGNHDVWIQSGELTSPKTRYVVKKQ